MEKNIKWWKNALVYQIYPLSFKDSNSDGVGDLKGIISKLDYLKSYGVDVVWLSPVYESPMDDNGYDISDYTKVNPLFGTMEDLQELIDGLHSRGMKLIMDLVVNHTSDEHIWFKEALNNPNSKYHDYYIWNKEAKPEIGSVFSGSAWEYVEHLDKYYFHLFSRRQPDLNWHNKEMREEIYQMINSWLDKGVDGFRMDVIELIGKDVLNGKIGDGPYLETYLFEMWERCFKGRDIMNIGEMGGISQERAGELTSIENSGLHMTFQFSHLSVDQEAWKSKWHIKPVDFKELKNVFIKNHEIFKEKGWNSLFLSNHDQPRQISRFGDENYRVKSGQMLFLMIYGQKGTPYVYQGEEIGMTGIKFDDLKSYKDVETLNWYKEATQLGWPHERIMKSIYSKGRDNSRTPFQWNNKPFAGFSDVKPWLEVNPNYQTINAELELNDDDSVYHFSKRLFEIRKAFDVFTDGEFKCLDQEASSTFIYKRFNQTHEALIITNLTNKEQEIHLEEIKGFSIVLSNYDIKLSKRMILPPYAAILSIKGV